MKTLNLKSVLVLISILGISSTLFGQKYYSKVTYGSDSATRKECAMNLSVMSEYVKINSFDLAYDAWHYCFMNCPAAKKNIYINGAKIIRNKIENETDETIQSAWVDTLMLLFDRRIENFKEEGRVNGYKGIDLLKYRKSDLEIAYGYLEKSVDLSQVKVDESVIITFISATHALMEQGIILPDVMINNYVKVMDILDQKVASGDTDRKIPMAVESVEKVFAESGAADCESLISIFQPKFEENPEDLDFLKKVTTLLKQTSCESSDLYAKTAEKLFSLEPSADAASKLGGLFAFKEDYTKAISYYNQAIEQETDTDKKASYYYQLAKIYYQKKDYPTARKNSLSAISLKSNYGEAYILIGSAYAASSATCGSSDFEKKAVYWAAVDKFNKAKSVDPSVKETADTQINAYSQRFPNNEDAFFNNFTDGKSYTVGCWINEKTIVRTTK